MQQGLKTRPRARTMMDTVLFQGDNWLYFPASEALFQREASLSHAHMGNRIVPRGLASLLRWGSTAGVLMTSERETRSEKQKGPQKES